MTELAFAGRHTCDSPEWYTPTLFVDAAREVMGGIDLDPASHEEANERLQIPRFFTEADNGLLRDWFGRVFINPPGGLVNEFWIALLLHYLAGRVEQAVWIGYSLEQLQTLQKSGARLAPVTYLTCFSDSRIAFVENEAKKAQRIEKLLAKGEAPNASKAARKVAESIRRGNPPADSPSHSNYITYLGPNIDAFRRVFSRFGVVK